MRVKLCKATLTDYPLIQNMARFYVYDMSRFCGFISDDWACPVDGLYESDDFKNYFIDETRKAFLVKIEDELAGFVLLNKIGTLPETEWNMGEFFIIAKFQGKGIAREVVNQIWKSYPGKWEVSVIPENKHALNFWRKTINHFTNGNYKEEIKKVDYDKHQPKRYILNFDTNEQNIQPQQSEKISIEEINPDQAETLCRSITNDLPEYFGISSANEQYFAGVRSCRNLAAKINGQYVGLISLNFPYPNNINIYWMAISKDHQAKGIGRQLMVEACKFAKKQNANSITVETLSPVESDENYLKTYRFYQSSGFNPLINIKPDGYEWNMVYMVKQLSNAMNDLLSLEKDAREFGFEWPNEAMIIEQVIDECREIKEAIVQQEMHGRIQEEIGDLLHSAVSLCEFAGFDVEETLAKINNKFGKRMQAIKKLTYELGLSNLKGQSIEFMMELWRKAKVG